MEITIYQTAAELGKAAGTATAALIREEIKKNGRANIILATGTSQFETLKQLIVEPGIDWGKVVMFHLDEYIGLPITHPGSFRKYLNDRFIVVLPAGSQPIPTLCAGIFCASGINFAFRYSIS